VVTPFNAVLSVDRDGTRVVCAGELDMATAPTFYEAILQAHEKHPGDVTADLAGVTFMDSRGVAALVMAHRHLTSRGAHLRINNAQRPVALVLDATGVGAHLDSASLE
jgi:anti-sigma B factor antagonist